MATDLIKQYLQYAAPYAKKYNLDPWAMMAVAHAESGLDPNSIGDNGQSFGYHQFYTKGAGGANARQYLDPRKNVEYAARLMAKAGASGLKGQAAIDAMVRKFERPANPSGEVQRALEFYNQNNKGSLPTGGATLGFNPAAASALIPTQETSPLSDSRDTLMQTIMAQNGQKVSSDQMTQTLIGTIQQQSAALTAQSGKPTVAGFPGIGAPLQFEDGATPGNTHPSKIGESIVKAAKQFLGVPYVWGGESPKGFDCSGLVQYVFGKYGIKTPRVSQEQFNHGKHISVNDAQAGDLVFFRHGAGGDVGHVGIYIGGGKFIQAPHTGDVVKISNLKGYGNLAGIRRYT